ncbi:MAG: hypothetical protein HKO59_09710 [Phycisphaerales bacterium]|nr:hypothetical protein [Phycisphaerales bacterium]
MSTLPADQQPGRPGEAGTPIEDEAYAAAMRAAHVAPRNPEAWYGEHDVLDGRRFGTHEETHGTPSGSRVPENSYALLNQESPEFIRFINPGDLRVAAHTCGPCHPGHVANVGHSMMTHGSMLWGAALYNNGAIPNKTARFGESYSAFGLPQRLQGVIDDAEWDKDAERLVTDMRWPSEQERRERGILSHLDPLPVWNVGQPGNILRIFERGTKLPVPGGATLNPNPAEIGNPNPLVEGGRPDKGLSPRGLGTLNRIDPVFLGIQKTRLLDPNLSFAGTNDHPGDYRASGCTACHVPYANDRDPAHSGPVYAAHAGRHGFSATKDPTIPKNEAGHPVQHGFTTAIPSSQCITCHIHPGTSYANSYLGYMWWDNESDGAAMYPATSRRPTPEEEWRALRRNPDAAQLKGLWGDLYPDAVAHTGEAAGPGFLERTGSPEFNAALEHNQFADFHGHGWVFRAVHQKDRRGRLLTTTGRIKELVASDAIDPPADPRYQTPLTDGDHHETMPIDPADPHKWKLAVHLQDVHLQKGMHCVDCHFSQDNHGDGKLYGEVRNAIEITCIDCHGTYRKKATLRTSGPAAPAEGRNLANLTVRDEDGDKVDRFVIDKKTGQIRQRSAIDPGLSWPVVQTIDTIDPTSEWAKNNQRAAHASRYAKTIQRDGTTWGDLPAEGDGCLAHDTSSMECYTCHTSWMTSCFGCHLPMRANQRTPMLHNESLYTRNFTQYNFQVLRDDVFMLGHDGVHRSGEIDDTGALVRPGRIVPVRSSSAVVVSSQNQNREWVYHQQQTVSAEGYSGQTFNPHYPHAVSGVGTTKSCTDCHVSRANDNNAWMAQLLLQGTNYVNFFGRYVYVATGRDGLVAVAVTEHDEPQAVYGSNLHQLAYPDEHAAFAAAGGELDESYHHDAGWGNEILDLQLRGEYLYAARGRGGFWVYDVANIDNKGFSERIVTAPVSPLGQRLGFDTTDAVAVASPSTVAVDPARRRLSSDPQQPPATIMDPPQPWHVNREQAVHPMYAYLYVGDRVEGLILTGAATLLDGDPRNNFMDRATLDDGTTAFNPGDQLAGLRGLTIAGHYVYATCDAGLVVIDIDVPLAPRIVAVIDTSVLPTPQAVAVQFRYAFVTCADGLRTVDITDPTRPRVVPGAFVPLETTHRLYVARTWAFVAAGSQGLAIVDVTNPERPRLDQLYDAGGRLTDTRDVKVGMTNASLFAYVADGHNGLRVVELMGPHTTSQFRGFSPDRLSPRLIAEHHTHGPALAVSKGLDRDRAVDESGNQIAVFGRIGARPLALEVMQRMYLRDGTLWTVSDDPDDWGEAQEWSFERADAKPEPAEGGRRPRRGGKRSR